MSDDTPNTVAADALRELNQAIDAGDTERFERLLADVPDLNARDASGWLPLKRAIHAGSASFVERLLKAGADPNALPEGDESSALAAAVNNNRPDLVELLLRHGAVPRTLRPRDLQPLSTACVLKSVEMVRMLLDAGAAVDGDGGDSTLISTARAVAPDVAELLLARGPTCATGGSRACTTGSPPAASRRRTSGSTPSRRRRRRRQTTRRTVARQRGDAEPCRAAFRPAVSEFVPSRTYETG